MAARRQEDPKVRALRETRSLNPRPEVVSDRAFAASEFLDARDLVQVKYEMVRRVRVEGEKVARAADTFGFSRQSFYATQAALDQGGLPALVPQRPGPKRARKLSEEVLSFCRRATRDRSCAASQGLGGGDRRALRRPGASALDRACARPPGGGRSEPEKRLTPAREPELAGIEAGYERLRAAVLAGRPDGFRLGHGVLAARGLVAWIETVSSVGWPVSTVSESSRPPAGGLVSLPGADQLVAVIAQMALAHVA